MKSILTIYLKTLMDQWQNVWKDKTQQNRFFITLVVLIVTIWSLSRFLDYIELRPGVVLADPLLQSFAPIDLTWLTFLVIYFSVILSVIFLLLEPRRLMATLHAYILLVLVRMLSMYLIPLDPPPLLIPLADPFVESLSSGTLTRDLFFSGHTSTLFLLYLTANNKYLRRLFLLCTLIVGLCVLVQHVHYTIDVIAAPFYCYACYRLSLLLNRQVAGGKL